MVAMWLLLLLSPLLLLHASHALIGGSDAAPGQFPYQVLTRGVDKDPLRQFGTGALIHPEWVLTNAESVCGYVSLVVTLGVVERNESSPSRQDIPARRIVVHPKWPGQWVYMKAHLNDVGLVQLDRPATLGDNVAIAYLPESGGYTRYNGRAATIAGWGHHMSGAMGYRDQNHLQWEATTVMGIMKCYWHRFSVSEHTGWLRRNHICADTKGTGPCDGDGGAPLVVRDAKGRNVVVGLFTTPIVRGEACQSDYPSVYTRVASHLDWIKSVTTATDSPSTH